MDAVKEAAVFHAKNRGAVVHVIASTAAASTDFTANQTGYGVTSEGSARLRDLPGLRPGDEDT